MASLGLPAFPLFGFPVGLEFNISGSGFSRRATLTFVTVGRTFPHETMMEPPSPPPAPRRTGVRRSRERVGERMAQAPSEPDASVPEVVRCFFFVFFLCVDLLLHYLSSHVATFLQLSCYRPCLPFSDVIFIYFIAT